jgi:hypothetical protein
VVLRSNEKRVNEMKKVIINILLYLIIPTVLWGQEINPTKTVGPSPANYPTLNDAFFDINSGLLKGAIVLRITGNITESTTAELFESGYGSTSSYTSVIIYPTSAGYIIDGDFDGPLISLNGADNVTIDGSVNASGSAKNLTITNINTGPSVSTIQFINDATSNFVKYCIIKGSATNTTGGVIFFSTSGIGTGNNNNTIDNNEITSDAAGRPINALYSFGTSGQENSGNTISNNYFYNFLDKGNASNGIFLSSNTTTWTILGNSFYETAPFVPSASVEYYAIQINHPDQVLLSVETISEAGLLHAADLH